MKAYSEWSVSKLKAELAKIEKAIEAAESRERQTALDKVRSVAKQHGFELTELVDGAGGGRRRGTRNTRPKAKVAPKYRNPNDPSQTWSGRGRTPRWMQDHVDGGGNREDLGIG